MIDALRKKNRRLVEICKGSPPEGTRASRTRMEAGRNSLESMVGPVVCAVCGQAAGYSRTELVTDRQDRVGGRGREGGLAFFTLLPLVRCMSAFLVPKSYLFIS